MCSKNRLRNAAIVTPSQITLTTEQKIFQMVNEKNINLLDRNVFLKLTPL